MNTSLSRIIWGLGITVLGVGLLLNAFNVGGLEDVLTTWWPLFIILAGIGMLLSNIRQYLVPMFVILIGIIVQLNQLDVIKVNIFELLLPLVIIAIGLSFLLRQESKNPEETRDTTNDIFAILGGIDTKNHSSDYQGGKATAVMGGVSLDLREAKIQKEARLDVITFMGGIDLKVPKEWEVHVSGQPILGGWDNKSAKPSSKNPPILHVNAMCIMGGVNIKN